jgi:hypothetical protein
MLRTPWISQAIIQQVTREHEDRRKQA